MDERTSSYTNQTDTTHAVLYNVCLIVEYLQPLQHCCVVYIL